MLQYKRDNMLPPDEAAARRLRRTQAWYCEIGGLSSTRASQVAFVAASFSSNILLRVDASVFNRRISVRSTRSDFCSSLLASPVA
ncbi:unnamed protein product [Musa textilis]